MRNIPLQRTCAFVAASVDTRHSAVFYWPATRNEEKDHGVNRRRFVESAVLAGVGAMLGGGAPARAALAARQRWILPTDTPDRFHLKVMAFNPIPVPNLQAFELQIEGM